MPAAWIWILVYVLAFTLFQLLLYQYLQREEGPSVEQATPDYGENAVGPNQIAPAPVEAENGDGVRCPRCGAFNESDAAFTYCQECVHRLR